MIKNIIFDMDGVIRELKNAPINELLPEDLKEKYKDLYDNKRLCDIVAKYINLDCFKEWDKGNVSAEYVYNTLLENSSEPKEAVKYIFGAPLTKEYNIIYPETIKLISSLKVKGYKIFILSNMSSEIVEILKQLIDMSLFEDVVFSCDVGLRKPDPKFYKYALDRWEIEPNESIFIDDNPKNLPPFENLGVKCFLFDNSNITTTIENFKSLISNS